MKDGDSVIEHLNAFNTVVSQLLSVDIIISDEDWKKLDRKAKSTIRLCVSDSVLLNISGEATANNLWDKLGTL